MLLLGKSNLREIHRNLGVLGKYYRYSGGRARPVIEHRIKFFTFHLITLIDLLIIRKKSMEAKTIDIDMNNVVHEKERQSNSIRTNIFNSSSIKFSKITPALNNCLQSSESSLYQSLLKSVLMRAKSSAFGGKRED